MLGRSLVHQKAGIDTEFPESADALLPFYCMFYSHSTPFYCTFSSARIMAITHWLVKDLLPPAG